MKLGDAGYAAIARHCMQLQELRLYASMPSARAIKGFSALKQLLLVDICGAHQVTGMPHHSVPRSRGLCMASTPGAHLPHGSARLACLCKVCIRLGFRHQADFSVE